MDFDDTQVEVQLEGVTHNSFARPNLLIRLFCSCKLCWEQVYSNVNMMLPVQI